MADLNAFFGKFLPKKLSENPDLIAEIGGVYQFDIEGAGQWTVDCTGAGGVSEGPCDDPGCVVSATKEDFESMLENPASGMMLFMAGKLQVSNVGMAMSLQKLLS